MRHLKIHLSRLRSSKKIRTRTTTLTSCALWVTAGLSATSSSQWTGSKSNLRLVVSSRPWPPQQPQSLASNLSNWSNISEQSKKRTIGTFSLILPFPLCRQVSLAMFRRQSSLKKLKPRFGTVGKSMDGNLISRKSSKKLNKNTKDSR